MSAKKYLLVVGGPTASGKTDFAVALARYFDTEILSADSRQFYREMSIGTAKPDEATLSTVPHHFVNSLSITESYSAGDFEREALEILDKIYQTKNIAILAGGSGLFIRAVCEGLDEFPEVPPSVRQLVEQWYLEGGLTGLQKRLAAADPDYFAVVDKDNPQRLMRALAVQEASGNPYSSFRRGKSVARTFIPIYIALHRPREVLYERINHRVDQMVEQGLVAEARSLFAQSHLNALQTVGYQELFEHFSGNCSLETAINAIKQHSRNYAKRQMTWFRNQGSWKHFKPEETTLCLAYLEWAMQKEAVLSSQKSATTPALILSQISFSCPTSPLIAAQLVQSRHAACILLPEVQTEASSFLLHECLLRVEGKPTFVCGALPLLPGLHFSSILQDEMPDLFLPFCKNVKSELFSIENKGNYPAS